MKCGSTLTRQRDSRQDLVVVHHVAQAQELLDLIHNGGRLALQHLPVQDQQLEEEEGTKEERF